MSSPAALIERMGFGLAQWKVLLAVGGSKLADGAELLLLGSVTKAVSGEWDLDMWQRGIVVSVVFFGVLIGNLMSGFLGDQMGRRLPVILSYIGIGAFSLVSMAATGFATISFTRFLVGVSFGISGPACNTLCAETAPSRFRLKMNAYCMIFFSGGELYSAILVWTQDPYMVQLNWRWLVCMGAIPSFIFLGFALLVLHESPSFLMVQGKFEEAEKVLEDFKRSNGARDVHIDLAKNVEQVCESPRSFDSFLQKLGIVFGRHLLYTTLVVCASVFTLNFLFYGGLYALPQVLPQMKLHVSPSINLMIGAVAELPGYMLAVTFGDFFSRKNAMLLYLLAAIMSTLTFSMASMQMLNATPIHNYEVLVQMGLVGNKVFTAVGFLVVYCYSTEVYPTVVRTTGGAFCLAFGRMGAIIAPTVFEHLLFTTGSYAAFFNLTAGLCAINAMMVLFLPFETQGCVLQDHLEEQQPLASKSSKIP
jgi:putative MFS transporter